jgi:hypothetical protein
MGDDNIAAHAVQDVNGLCLARLPGPRHERVRLGGERADGTEVDDVAGELGHEHFLDVGADLHGVAAPGGAQVLHARHLRGESDTPEKNTMLKNSRYTGSFLKYLCRYIVYTVVEPDFFALVRGFGSGSNTK